MNKIYTLREDDPGEGLYRRIHLLIRKNGWEWQAIGAAFGIAGGMLSIILGPLSWTAVRLLAPGNTVPVLNVLGIIFFVLPLPLLALGAHCLDLLEQRPPLLPLPVESQPDSYVRRLRLRPQRPHRN